MKRRDEGHIAELLLSNDTELERTCLVISQVVKKGAFTLEEALDLYEVSFEKYTGYLAATIADELNKEATGMIGYFPTKQRELSLKAAVLSKFFEIFLPVTLLEDAKDKKHAREVQSDLKKLIRAI